MYGLGRFTIIKKWTLVNFSNIDIFVTFVFLLTVFLLTITSSKFGKTNPKVGHVRQKKNVGVFLFHKTYNCRKVSKNIYRKFIFRYKKLLKLLVFLRYQNF